MRHVLVGKWMIPESFFDLEKQLCNNKSWALSRSKECHCQSMQSRDIFMKANFTTKCKPLVTLNFANKHLKTSATILWTDETRINSYHNNVKMHCGGALRQNEKNCATIQTLNCSCCSLLLSLCLIILSCLPTCFACLCPAFLLFASTRLCYFFEFSWIFPPPVDLRILLSALCSCFC